MSAPSATALESPLVRAAALLRLPDSPDLTPELSADGQSLCCPRTGRRFALTGGILDLLGDDFEKTPAQKPLDVPAIAWAYDRLRPHLPWLLGIPSFDAEVEQMTRRLDLRRGDVVLDVACGHGNFTVEIARRVTGTGLVIGVDIAGAMLRRAAARIEREGLCNVLLVRGDAQALPIASGSVRRINCSGGLHGIPDLGRALPEFARAGTPDARFTGTGFALAPRDLLARLKRAAQRRWSMNFVDMSWVAAELGRQGFSGVDHALESSWFGGVWGRKGADGGSPPRGSAR